MPKKSEISKVAYRANSARQLTVIQNILSKIKGTVDSALTDVTNAAESMNDDPQYFGNAIRTEVSDIQAKLNTIKNVVDQNQIE